MADTAIEWTDKTWNPMAGCSIVSAGCANCYAMKMAARVESMQWAHAAAGRPTNDKYEGLTKKVNGKTVWTGRVNFNESALALPLTWKKPKRIFVNSMSDLFHEDVSMDWIIDVFTIMALSPQHTFQVLTKRPERMRHVLRNDRCIELDILKNAHKYQGGISGGWGWPLPNVWLGVSVEDQATADARIPELLKTPAAVRFVSYEPALGPVDFENVRHALAGDSFEVGSVLRGDDGFGQNAVRSRIDWLICGGESGPGARPMHPDWARSARDQCRAARVKFFFKQWGEWAPVTYHAAAGCEHDTLPTYQTAAHEVVALTTSKFCAGKRVGHLGKKAAGRILDGRTWDEFPEVPA